MKTTEVVVELVVVGSGFLAVSAMAIGNYIQWTTPPELLNNSVLLGLLLFVSSYVMGILIDRVADTLFSPIEDYWRRKEFESVEHFQKYRISAYKSSEILRDWGQYSRVRARVCRGWCVNSALLFIVISWKIKPDRLDLYFFAGALFLLLLWSWIQLARGEILRLRTLQCSSSEDSDN